MAQHSIAKLIKYAKETKIPWAIEGLWQEGGIAIVHSLEEEFKSVCAYQIAEAIAAGAPLLRVWNVPQSRRVGIFETEMDDLEVGRRLAMMYPNESWPEKLVVSDEELLRKFRERHTLGEKFNCLEDWIRGQGLEMLIWDTINSTLAVGDPNSESSVSRFFDYLGLLPVKGSLLVRHDVKPSRDSAMRASNQKVRGSNRLVEDASLVIHLARQDKASHKVRLEIGKLRNAPKPEPLELWFDAGTFRLTPIPPVAAILEAGPLTREEVVERAVTRFGVKARSVDEQCRELQPCLDKSQEGHRRVLTLNRNAILESDSTSPIARWWMLLRPPSPPDGEMQPCISTHSTLPEQSDPLPDSKFTNNSELPSSEGGKTAVSQ
jgi:hypothetical protein